MTKAPAGQKRVYARLSTRQKRVYARLLEGCGGGDQSILAAVESDAKGQLGAASVRCRQSGGLKLRPGRAVRSNAARCDVPSCDFIDSEPCSYQDRIPQG